MKRFKSVISLLLVLAICISASFVVSAKNNGAKYYAAKGIEAVIKGALGTVNLLIPDGKNVIKKSDYQSKNFLKGTGSFLDSVPENAVWKLGSSEISLVPEDYKDYSYFIGGYMMIENGMYNRVEELLDDMRARVIAVEDGTGRGTAVFATIDCIGMTNKDIREIRQRLMQKLPDASFSTITVNSTHCHSGIDTEGLWTNTFSKVVKNAVKSILHIGSLETGTDQKYMEFLYDTVSDAMVNAYNNMTVGTMTYATKDIGSSYFVNKNRASASALMTDMNRFVFTPDDSSVKPTMIVNVAAHPDVAGLPTSDGQSNGRGISGDYVYYMGQTINGYGYNFMFFNGAIAGIYMSRGKTNNGQTFTKRVQQSERYGIELGKIALAMTMTQSEIEDEEYLSDDAVEQKEREIASSNGAQYRLWYENWVPVSEIPVSPLLNIRLMEVLLPVTNPLILVAGKLNLAAYDILKENGKYYIYSEIGYMELGNGLVKIAMMPGEVCQDLVMGGSSLTSDGSFKGQAFGQKTIRELFGQDTICFGLSNDAIGYIVPDNDYCMCGVFDHYHEIVGIGEFAASTLMKGYAELAESCGK